ncbi:MAG TPA: ATP-binding cassette domain-containing protein, partial [Savagea sp.]
MGLRIEHVTKTFGAHRAVDGVSFAVERGQLYGYLGANGAGKTTTFRMILGLLQPTEGTITWNGRPIDDRARKEIGYLPEERG